MVLVEKLRINLNLKLCVVDVNSAPAAEIAADIHFDTAFADLRQFHGTVQSTVIIPI